ncbi:MAG: thioredoxin fold domain-containing protein [Bacteroidales bacterium]|nr:thioredoxin fold domain-containing protein [Bacteroidales bacterium]
MKTLKTITLAIVAIMMFAACGNAGAQNDKKTDKTQKAVKELNAESFSEKVFDMNSEELVFLGDKPVIVDFTASWCGPCQRIAPILEELAVEYDGKIIIYKVDIDKERGLAQSFNVSSIPAILYIPANGNEPVMTIGARGKEKFKEEIRTFLMEK